MREAGAFHNNLALHISAATLKGRRRLDRPAPWRVTLGKAAQAIGYMVLHAAVLFAALYACAFLWAVTP